jgi:hypothetical protein
LSTFSTRAAQLAQVMPWMPTERGVVMSELQIEADVSTLNLASVAGSNI